MLSKEQEIKKQVNFIFKDFDFSQFINIKIDEVTKLLKAYKQNKDIDSFVVEEDMTNKKIVIKIRLSGDEKEATIQKSNNDLLYIVEDDGK